MAVPIRTEREIEKMRTAGRMLAIVHKKLHAFLRPGISTEDVDAFCEAEIRRLGGIPNVLGYGGFPGSVCTSVNDVVVHGIPSGNVILQEGDIISLDTGLSYEGYHADAARTWGIGKISEEAQRLIHVTRESFFEGIRQAKAHHHLYEISSAVDEYASARGYGVVAGFAGHGIGRHLHEYPDVPNTTQKARGMILEPGMTFAVEPMITAGSPDVDLDEDDGWTVRTKDGSWAAHYENTILITEGDAEILTYDKGE